MKNSITSKFSRLHKISAFGLALLAGMPAGVLQAADINWSGGTASYTNAAGWGGTVPGPGDNAINDSGLANVVQINVGNPDWIFGDLIAGGSTGASGAFQQNGQTVTANGWFHLGAGTNSVGAYTLNGGTLNALNRLFMGEAPGSTSTLTINGGVLNKSGDVFVIADGAWNGVGARTATVNQTAGVINSSSEFQVGNIPLGNGIYNLSGGTNNISNWFAVGRFGGTGTLNVSGGAIIKTGGGNFYVGEGVGTGEFNFTGGVIDINSEYWLANGGPSVAVQNMSGAASLSVGNWIAIGRGGGNGTLNLTNGTITRTGSGNFAIGSGGGSVGTLNQYGGAITNTANPGSYTYLGESSGNGLWNMNGGTANLGILQFCQGGGGSGTLNLNAGLISASEVNCGIDGANGTLYFNGGTLRASGDNANFFHGLGAAYLQAGGAIFDSQGFNVAVAQSLTDNGGGGLTKIGSGTVTLTGFNSHTGPTLVSAGTLAVTTDSTGAGDYTVTSGAQLVVKVQSANAQLNVANFTFSSATPALGLDLGAFGNPTAAPVNVIGNLAVNGTVLVNVTDALPQIGQFPLIQYGSRTGSGSFVVGSLPVGVAASIVTNGSTIALNITSVNLPRWGGQAGGDWDIGLTATWINIGDNLATTYGQGNFVLFDDNATGTTTVNLTTTLNPGSVTANNSGLNYTFVGSGKISGATGILKQGTGNLSILNSGGNNYTGGTVISNGVLSVTNLANGGAASAIGASSASPTNLVIGKGVLSYAGPAVTINRGYTLAATNSTIDVQTSLALSGAVTANSGSALIKTGPGQLAYVGTVSNLLSGGYTPGLNVMQGTVKFDGAAGSQTNRISSDVWVGSTPNFGAALILTNSMLQVDGWVGAGRGNGSVGNITTLNLTNAILSANGISLGWDNALAGNYSFQTSTLSGNSTLTNRGGNGSQLAESGGSTTIMNINDTSVFGSNPRLIIAGGNAATGLVTVANSGKLYVNSFISIANGNGAVGSVVVKDNGNFFVASDLNASDTGSSTGSLTVQGNAFVSGGTVYIGKAGTSVGNATVTSGTLNSRGNFRVGQNAGSVGNVNISGGTIGIANELWMGEAGTGNWTQTGGAVWSTNWVAIGRNGGSTGIYNISGGSLAELTPGSRMIVGSSGAGTLTISGTGQVTSLGNFQIGENGGSTGTINLNGGSLTVPQVIKGAGIGNFNFNGGTLIAGNAANANFFNGLTAASVKVGGVTINSGTNIINIGQPLLDGTGGGGLTKTGTGTLRLNGTNTYTGTTLVSFGTLGGTGIIASPVSVAAGATLAPGASIGTLTISNTLTLAGGSTTSVEISLDGGVSSDLVKGLTGLNYAGALVVTNVGTNSLAAGGVFQLFSSVNPGAGNFSSVTILPSGAGTFNPATGQLTIPSTLPPTVNPPYASGGNLILAGTGGTPGGSYVWLTATNVTAPIGTWTTNSTGVFNGSGAFSNAVPINPLEAARFFRLKTP